MRVRPAAFFGLLAVAAGAGLLINAERDAARPAQRRQQQTATGSFAVPVPVTPVIKQPLPIDREYVATTEAIRSVFLQAKVTGYLVERAAADGADVEKGEVLYRIDPRDYRVALAQAKAQEQRDKAASAYASANFQRNATLNKNGWVSKDVFDQTQSALRQLQAAIAVDQAAIEAAELNLGYTEIRAPFAGRLSRSALQEGALISVAGAPLNTLVQLDPLYVTFNPSETDIPQIQEYWSRGPISADVMLEGKAEPSYHGTLSFLDNAVDHRVGTIAARVTLANPKRKLLPGQFVRVRLHLGKRPDALFAPQVALGSAQTGRFLYIVGQGNKVEQRFVSPGAVQGDLVSVTGSVREGELVITGNLQKIGPGAAVKPQLSRIESSPSG